MNRVLLVFSIILLLFGSIKAEDFYIKEYKVTVKLNADGTFNVKEEILVFFTAPRRGIIRSIPYRHFVKPVDSLGVEEGYFEESYHDVYIKNIQVDGHPFFVSSTYYDREIKIGNAAQTISGEQLYVISYDVENAIRKFGDLLLFDWSIIGYQWDCDIQSATFKIELPFQTDQLIRYKVETSSMPNKSTKADFLVADSTIAGKTTDTLQKYEGIYVQMLIPLSVFGKNFNLIRQIADNFYFDSCYTELRILPGGVLDVSHTFWFFLSPEKKKSELIAYFEIEKNIGKSLFFPRPDDEYRADYSFLKKDYFLDVSDKTINCNGKIKEKDDLIQFKWYMVGVSPDSALKMHYTIFNVLKPEEKNYTLFMPLFGPLNVPLRTGRVDIIFHDDINLEEISGQILSRRSDYSYAEKTDSLYLLGKNILSGKIPLLTTHNQPDILLTFPTETVGELNTGAKIKILIKNNYLLIFPVIFLILLFVLWLFLGKDKKPVVVVRYHPPEKLTPAEAGFLWDFKIHKRDLTSLIYHWAANGHLTITEIKDEDYKFVKKSPLKKNAKKFEKTIFNRIFKNREEVKLSSLEYKMSDAFQKAYKELKNEVLKDKMFTKGSRLTGSVLFFLGIVAVIISIITSLTEYSVGENFQIPLCYLSCGALAIFFGKIMPQRGVNGIPLYNELVGFREFIEKAEVDRLKEICEQEPDYYSKTMAYAIVLGLGKEWAKKFEPILSASPDWYSSSSGSAFRVSAFHSSIISGMTKMDKTLASPSSGSYRGGSYGGSYSSGGRSFGGYSGGGRSYGGGGGRSW